MKTTGIIFLLFFSTLTLSAQNSDLKKILTNIAWETVNNNDWFNSNSLIFKKHIADKSYYEGVKIVLYDDKTIEVSHMEPTVVDTSFSERKQIGNWTLENDILSSSIPILGNQTKFKIVEINDKKLIFQLLK